MAPPAKRQRKPLSDDARKRKRDSDRSRAHTRVNLGKAFDEWRQLKETEELQSDAHVALLLLNTYQKFTNKVSAQKTENVKSPKEPEADEEEKPSLTSLRSISQSILSGPVLKCPACGFVLKVLHGKEPHQPQSIEVTLELEETEEPVSGAEEADGSDGDIKEEEEESEEGSRVEQWKEEEEEEEEEERGGARDQEWRRVTEDRTLTTTGLLSFGIKLQNKIMTLSETKRVKTRPSPNGRSSFAPSVESFTRRATSATTKQNPSCATPAAGGSSPNPPSKSTATCTRKRTNTSASSATPASKPK
ncbi:histone H3.v1-like isoform X2 [Boleophthalmus pectinirostris]|uniref:histone H3.v1-like isoform X2 n=1 Tax=Boleophthalmus pectinirostris TaxID=150288 RepID=UPI00242DA695|nr:histone H3.v1-like isoform X2 [Boleophthalmus pectinirostris]XP_055010878.1 histone H3.v1-like isoform X2 [Boleophthalmus pectinirostris]XP_055010879.1 histone H3.v1-like isoform X2 [Boleophthalmus pectinirostris]